MKPLHWSVVLVVLAGLLPCSGERRPSMRAAGVDRSHEVTGSDDTGRPDDDPERSREPSLDELDGLGRLTLEEAWPAVERLRAWFRKAPEEVTRELQERIESLRGRARLLAAELLTSRREDSLYQLGRLALVQIATGDADKETRIGALRLLAGKSYSESVYLALGDLSRMEADPDVVIEACLALWRLENRHSALKPVFQMLSGEDLQLQYKAALALAEIGLYTQPIDERLRSLQGEPTARSRRARSLLEQLTGGSPPAGRGDEVLRLRSRIRDLERELSLLSSTAPEPPPQSGWTAIVESVVNKVLKYSFRGHELDRRDLYIAALRGVLSHPDPYSRFLAPSDVERQEAQNSGFYRGFGVRLVKPAAGEPLVVVKAYKGGPAFAAGLRTGDRLLTLNGVATAQHPIDLFESWTSTAESLALTVRRWGREPEALSIQRSRIDTPYVKWKMLPHDVGYVQVLFFGRNVLVEFERALSSLEAQGVKRLLLDLRNNRGGLLAEAIGLVDLFVSRDVGLPIATLKGGGDKQEVFHPTRPAPRFASPLVVLVNRYTASAAELVAGALQDMDRARLVGERTYGKGLEQRVLNLDAGAEELLGGQGRFVISTRSIHLPLGRTYHAQHDANGRPSDGHHGGIDPDIVEESYRDAYTTDQLLEFDTVTFSTEVDDFIHANFQTILSHHEEGDLWDPTEAPEFEPLYAKLATRLTRSDVRRALRLLIQLHLEDQSGEEIVGDYSEDLQLQRAILQVMVESGHLREAMPHPYRELAEMHFAAEELQRP